MIITGPQGGLYLDRSSVLQVRERGMAGIGYRQDMPPKGGYATFKYTHNIPRRGPSGLAIMLGGVAVMAAGFYVVKKTNEERRYI